MDKNLCKHKLRICSRCAHVSDAAKRMSDTVNALVVFTPWDLLVRSCMAFRLDDGTTDGVLYPDRNTALRFQLRPCCVLYFRRCATGASPLDMHLFMEMARQAYEADNIAWTDPQSPDLIISQTSSEILKGVRSPW